MTNTNTNTNPTPAAVDRPATHRRAGPSRWARAVLWVPGLVVGAGAAVATAHGLYEIALAAGVPEPIAWLYPLITDGLALVAYAATPSLHGPAARYARAVVLLAAGLSGLAQAVYLVSGSTLAPPAVLRFGLGAWPAVAAAIVAHLLYLFATTNTAASPGEPRADTPTNPAAYARGDGAVPALQPPRLPDGVQLGVFNPAAVQPDPSPVQPFTVEPVQPSTSPTVQSAPTAHPELAPVERPDRSLGGSPVRERARAAAARHAQRHGALPTVSELESLAEVSRGTAAAVLKALRDHPTPLHLITTDPEPDDDSIEERTQP